jgi:putative transposase
VYNKLVPDCRRRRVAGATYFFTVNLLDRKSHLLIERIGVLRRAVARVRVDATLTLGEALSPSRRARGERGIWQRRYWEHKVRDKRDYASYMDYIHFKDLTAARPPRRRQGSSSFCSENQKLLLASLRAHRGGHFSQQIKVFCFFFSKKKYFLASPVCQPPRGLERDRLRLTST